MQKTRTFAAGVVIFIATLALIPARAQREDSSLAAQGRDHPKMLRKGINAIPHHYIVVLDIDATGEKGDFSAAVARAKNLCAISVDIHFRSVRSIRDDVIELKTTGVHVNV